MRRVLEGQALHSPDIQNNLSEKPNKYIFKIFFKSLFSTSKFIEMYEFLRAYLFTQLCFQNIKLQIYLRVYSYHLSPTLFM